MSFTERYIRLHEQGGQYEKSTDGMRFPSRSGWCDVAVEGEMIFSHRVTDYTKDTFTEGLHAHDYYELLFYLGGDVEYVSDNALISPTDLTAVWFCPGQMHTARLLAPSRYDRYVLYFSKELFRVGERVVPMPKFIGETSCAIVIPTEKQEELRQTLTRMEAIAAEARPHAPLLLKAYAITLLDLLCDPAMQAQQGNHFADAMAEVKRYIDVAFAEISSVAHVAERFFYSREHLSRAFRQSFNVSVAEYIAKRRVAESLPLLSTLRVADAAYAVGFHSQSAFIAAFKRYMGYPPSRHHLEKKRKR